MISKWVFGPLFFSRHTYCTYSTTVIQCGRITTFGLRIKGTYCLLVYEHKREACRLMHTYTLYRLVCRAVVVVDLCVSVWRSSIVELECDWSCSPFFYWSSVCVCVCVFVCLCIVDLCVSVWRSSIVGLECDWSHSPFFYCSSVCVCGWWFGLFLRFMDECTGMKSVLQVCCQISFLTDDSRSDPFCCCIQTCK